LLNKLLFNSRLWVSLLFTLIAILFAAPNFIKIDEDSSLPSQKVNLGLDLRGGSHLLLSVDFDSYLKDFVDSVTDNIRKEFRHNKIGYSNLVARNAEIHFSLRNAEDLDNVKKVINGFDSNFIIDYSDKSVRLSYNSLYLNTLKSRLIDQSIEIVRMRVDETGTKEPLIQRQGDTQILLQVPGLDDPSSLKKMLGKTAKLTFHLVDEDADVAAAMSGKLPADSMLVKSSDPQSSRYVVLKKKVVVSGDMLSYAAGSFYEARPVVSFELNSIGARLFAELTRNNPGKRMAIVLDNKLLTDPVINDPITSGKGFISGNFTIENATELGLLLRAGALPAPLSIVEERTVGPNLGTDSINSGMKAAIAGFVMVCIFMVWTYGVFGFFADIGLLVALLYILAMLSMFQATLTLPGIAGIILTMGMAVDANVLIYERIREEAKKGSSVLYSVKCGFEFAMDTIIDSNVTTLLAAMILYMFGVGTIKGFAVTLSIGIIASMFASVVVTKLFVDFWVAITKPKELKL
jgi:preprotein translocase subunit SecD